MNRVLVVTVVVGSVSWCGVACTNDFDQFNFEGVGGAAGAVSQGGAPSLQGGSAGEQNPNTGGSVAHAGASGSPAPSDGGQAPDNGGAPATGGSADAAAGTSGARTGGVSAGGGRAQGGAAGLSGADSGGQPGAGGSGACGDGEILCVGECVTASGDTQCGGCTNDCTQQGEAGGLVCIGVVCGCTANEQCGPDATCSAFGTCQCGWYNCRAGETCGPSGVCSCNGAAACAYGEVCCQSPAGCANLESDGNNCGACGQVCPAGQSCVSGSCE